MDGCKGGGDMTERDIASPGKCRLLELNRFHYAWRLFQKQKDGRNGAELGVGDPEERAVSGSEDTGAGLGSNKSLGPTEWPPAV
ncbi:hypothetical protein EYF80_044580 [Liparis tanakae]|uniref:Uncharacterized protein n=1 Tax=Liparis tanakae TaxID=230148 RepID=A0A4Z2FVD3_9TELE|nr:hypothetical protein EYF80_044580 [Liparis tanakae]